MVDVAPGSEKAVDMWQKVKEGDTILVHIIPTAGPHAGASIVSMSPRKELDSLVADISAMKKSHYARTLKSVKEGVRTAIMNPTDPTENGDLLTDILILFAFKLAGGREDEVLQNSGLMSLMLLISADESLTWQQRGMLDPVLVKSAGLDDRPSTIG